MPLSDYLEISDQRLRRLANRAGLSFERISAIADGDEATAAEVVRLSNALGVGVADLLRPEMRPQDAAYRFRSALLATSDGGRLQRRTVSEIAARVDGISEILTASGWQQGVWSAPEELRADPFALAAWFRESCLGGDQVSPVLHLAELLDQCLSVATVVLKRSAVDGVCAVVGRVPYILVRAQFKPRMLFTLAHELGHLLAHAGHDDFASVDLARSTGRAVSNRAEERFANDFACELLMPAQGVGIALQKVRNLLDVRDPGVGDIEILLLAHIFGVSFEVASRRCEQLRILPSGGAQALIDFVATNFGSAERRAQDAGLPPRPEPNFPSVSENVLRAAAQAVSDGELSVGRVLDRLQVSYEDLMAQRRGAHVEHHH